MLEVNVGEVLTSLRLLMQILRLGFLDIDELQLQDIQGL
jgi:hypothetical protein